MQRRSTTGNKLVVFWALTVCHALLTCLLTCLAWNTAYWCTELVVTLKLAVTHDWSLLAQTILICFDGRFNDRHSIERIASDPISPNYKVRIKWPHLTQLGGTCRARLALRRNPPIDLYFSTLAKPATSQCIWFGGIAQIVSEVMYCALGKRVLFNVTVESHVIRSLVPF